ncbi:hypothetical protein [Labedaea rhizosphaerae]|uniref:Uncharacterized protein n=1 Tax=Labedaea rhizosphaerae TaxID=598644 RepID=A0A4R6SCN3_LABRH|nr:hypothetical protein [Labedaea rhizosphaerae]TDP97670.1 hypothetical protein EV186_103634 [Labedaea rhizosphaerae]
MSDRVGEVYLQVAEHHMYGGELKVVRSTQKRPAVLEPGCILVKIKLSIPRAAWKPFEPEAIVTVPAELTEQAPVEVEAVSPDA